jgi:branched-chain amino acid transport system permease protein
VVYFSTVLELNFWVALVAAVALAAAVGVVIERSVLRPMIGKPAFAVAILTIGLDIVLRIVSTDLMGINIRPVGDPWGIGTLTFGDLTIPTKNMYTIVITALIVAALLAFFRFSRFGLAMRATALDQEVSLSMGVSVAGVFAMSWAIAAGLSAVAGMFLAAGTGLAPTLYPRAIRALPAVVIGGLDSIAGALAGSMIVGLAEAYTVAYQARYLGFLGDNFAQVVAYVVMFAVLLVRPYGLFGTAEVERV